MAPHSISEAQFLAGNVRKQNLPLFEAPSATDAPLLKRIALPQGHLAQFHDDAQPIHYIASIELREGTVRGNHFHKVKREFIYVLKGELLLLLEDVVSKDRESIPLKEGELVVINPGIAHALRVTQAGMAIEFSPARFDGSDIYRYPM